MDLVIAVLEVQQLVIEELDVSFTERELWWLPCHAVPARAYHVRNPFDFAVFRNQVLTGKISWWYSYIDCEKSLYMPAMQ